MEEIIWMNVQVWGRRPNHLQVKFLQTPKVDHLKQLNILQTIVFWHFKDKITYTVFWKSC